LVAEYVEVESGKRADRPKLREALAACQRLGARLIISKLDRLSRSVSFISNLMDSRADFLIVDMPDANRLTLHLMAAIAENEREMISRRTKDALAAARARGVTLGTPANLTTAAALRGRKLGLQVSRERARRFAERMSGQVTRLRQEGLSLRDIANVLNEEGALTASGKGTWTADAVRRILSSSSGGREPGNGRVQG
jgi:DNA invertase Pin-like site-specific DNA recombinase